MIKSITIGDIATYRKPVTINPSKINFFYGGNGAGKSTLVRFIVSQAGNFPSVIMQSGESPERIVTYNRDFIDKNFRAETGLPGIFTLGQESVEIREEISSLRTDIDKAQREIDDTQQSIHTLEETESGIKNELTEKLWKTQQEYGATFSNALIGFRSSKEKFSQECIRVITQYDTINPPDIEELKQLYNAAYSKTMQRMELCPCIDTVKIKELHGNTIIKKIITGRVDTPIGSFIEYLHAGDWVKQGIGFAKAAHGKCPYCQRDLSCDLQKDLEDFFDESYQRDYSELSQFAATYKAVTGQIIASIDNILDNRLDGFNYANLETLKVNLYQHVEHNIAEIKRKTEQPSIVIELDDVIEQVDDINEQIAKINKQIDANNEIIENQKRSQEQCKVQVWLFLASLVQSETNEFMKKSAGYKKGLKNLKEKETSLKQKIEEAKKKITEKESSIVSVEPTVTAINTLLVTFGFSGFAIEADPTNPGTYRIIRSDKSDASKTLSEGEYTFITFLYYYHLCFGSQTGSGLTDKKILIIDDPVSSLDSTVLFVVATLIKEIIGKCRDNRDGITQLFLLTHNVHFHKEITYLGSRDKFSPNDVRYYIIRKNGEESSIDKYEDNPIRTSYELLWNDIKEPDRVSPEGILNTMRRILEHYFQVVGGIKYEKCIAEFTGEEKIICQSLIAFINDGSHSIFDDVSLTLDAASIEKYLNVFKLIFTKLNHKEHYDMMMSRSAATI